MKLTQHTALFSSVSELFREALIGGTEQGLLVRVQSRHDHPGEQLPEGSDPPSPSQQGPAVYKHNHSLNEIKDNNGNSGTFFKICIY